VLGRPKANFVMYLVAEPRMTQLSYFQSHRAAPPGSLFAVDIVVDHPDSFACRFSRHAGYLQNGGVW
jgi:hypothetical protein